MSRSPVDVVCDAGPLIHLDELDSLDLLTDFRTVLAPEPVRREVRTHRPRAIEPPWLSFEQPGPDPAEDVSLLTLARALALDSGEQAALSVMRNHPGAVLLTDDAAARLAGQGLGFPVHGSIGVLLRAIRRGQRTQAEVAAILRRLPSTSSLHIRPRLLDEIIARVETGSTG